MTKANSYKITKSYLMIYILIAVLGVLFTVFLESRIMSTAASRKDAWIGIETVEVNRALVKQYDMTSSRGLLVTRVFMGSPAEAGGLVKGDIIRMWNGISTINQNQFHNLAKSVYVGQKVQLSVDRNGKPDMVYVKIGIRPGTY
ncbi:MAG: PDZ domain-containing protein [Candidatus Omnitrophica bacterium]|nr:PDZ domain-containing protein [Candidatus Omnitrophota bacterium]